MIGKCIIALGIHAGANSDEKAKHSMIPMQSWSQLEKQNKESEGAFQDFMKTKKELSLDGND